MARLVYDHEQLSRYFDRVAFPSSKRVYSVAELSRDEKLAYLGLLQKHQLVKVPWENLTQHYSWHRTVRVHPGHLFEKIVHNAGRGGYCMEVNFFFHHVLVSLGFDVYMAGARIYSPPKRKYGGWTHVVNVVTMAGKKYLLDGGMGPNGPDHPMPMVDGAVVEQIPPAQTRVTLETLPQHLDRSQKVWVFSYRYDDAKDWTPVYCFVDLEFLPEDIEAMNWDPWVNPRTFFTHKVVCVRFSTDKELTGPVKPGSATEDALEGEINGTMTLNHEVFKWRRNGKKIVEIRFETDRQRVDVLRDYYGIVLSDDDQQSVLGTGAEVGVKRAF